MFSYVDVTGLVLNANGTPAAGQQVLAVLSSPMTNGNVVESGPYRTRTAADGSYRLRVPSTGDIGTYPATSHYTVTSGSQLSATITVPTAATPLPLAAAPVVGGAGAITSVNGHTGVVVLGASDVSADPVGTAASLTAGVPIVRKFPFAFDTAGLLTGHTVYTPTVGDILLDAWVEINIAWDGTTPKFDVGEFVGDSSYGWYNGVAGPVDMTQAWIQGIGTGFLNSSGSLTLSQASIFAAVNSQLLVPAIPSVPSAQQPLTFQALLGFGPATPGKFVGAGPVKICVSQDGTIVGGDPGSTQGAAILYLVTVTPR